ncbi:Zinc-binding alcohol dehydrogenase domain-containing protein cipB [Daldinia childiae]|uniref:Zinc-binding alcohol dehydrogenase domain-containing protein cipB n=1 Tax=Daldinia childiae TaxID=326645 RepID=UPI0014489280|nr:Zinc-binding alcohol dehydrogenase domain-containing protein cipB [Daldinia childiae]KAF3058499.1 Zinc-binding alcohol dehydrogenase domain-containing protein cipB [Daldinia childiae]
MSPTTNRSFWQDKAGVPGTIRETAIPSTFSEDEVLVKVRAWGLNPVDAFIQNHPLPFFKYPLIPGQDIAGTIERVGLGSNSRRFKDYVVLDPALAVKIPDSLSFAEAAVFPLCLATAGHALFGPKYPLFSSPSKASGAPRTGKSVLIWGGASGVGSNAIQLAKAAGFNVLATCSPRNFEYVLGLGADMVFDYNSATVIDDIVAELDKSSCAGIFQAAGMTGDAIAPCCQISHRLRQKPFVACANVIPEGAVPEGVEAKFVFGGEDGRGMYYDTSSQLFGGFLEEALGLGTYKVAPTPEVVATKGLEGIQEGLDVVRKGVSAKKIVVLAGGL